MPSPSHPTNMTPGAPCQRTRQAGRSQPLADRRSTIRPHRPVLGGRSCRPASASRTWVSPNRARFLVATASPTLGAGPAEAAWVPLGESWPSRRLIELGDIHPDAQTFDTAGPIA